MPEAFICDYVRTPIGRFGGALAAVRTDDLAAVPLRALVARNPEVDWAGVDDVESMSRAPFVMPRRARLSPTRPRSTTPPSAGVSSTR